MSYVKRRKVKKKKKEKIAHPGYTRYGVMPKYTILKIERLEKNVQNAGHVKCHHRSKRIIDL